MRAKSVIAILFAFALIISSASIYAWQTQEVKAVEKGNTEPLLQDGIFTAELGMIENEPLYYLNGNYQKEDKIISCDGTVISGDEEGEFTGIFKGKNYFEIKIIFEEEPIIFSGKYKLEKNKKDFQGAWCNDGKCFDFVYPISYMMPDGSIITGDSEEEINLAIKAWYEANPGVKEKPILQYPVDIIYEDGTIQTINNEEEMKSAYENCGDKEWGWITGAFKGNGNNKETVLFRGDGIFNAELGIRGNERPILVLQGTYHSRGRLIFVQGSEDNRFSGVFIGNVFIIRTQLRGRIQTIFGQCRHGEDNSFTGAWISRGLQNRGWIEGTFN